MQRAGVVYALLAYGGWGLAPIYWKTLVQLDATEVIAHRVLWTLVFTGLLLTALRRGREVTAVLARPRQLLALLGSAAFIGANWLVFLWAVQHERILETSLGYYLNPLLNVVLGMAILGERLRRAQWIAVALAVLGVSVLVLRMGGVPWVSLALAGSFGAYGLLRKLSPVRPIPGLLIETALLAPAALAWLVLVPSSPGGALLGASPGVRTLLVGAGPVTSLPLLWFASAARRLPFSTLGLFQYIAPSVTFLLAVFAYGEPFTGTHGIAFGCIWLALALTTYDGLQRTGARR